MLVNKSNQHYCGCYPDNAVREYNYYLLASLIEVSRAVLIIRWLSIKEANGNTRVSQRRYKELCLADCTTVV